jgi:hypothetical protein
VNSLAARLAAVTVAVLIVAGLIGFYVTKLRRAPTPVAAAKTGPRQVQLTLKTEAAVGPQGGNPSWVSYLVRNPQGDWVHSTTFDLPAHAVVHVTVYQFDGDSGLRNPFLAQVQGTVGNVMQVNGKTQKTINPDDASHTFAVPQMGLLVPLYGVPDSAKNPCDEGPCSLKQDHETISFTFRTGKPGRYRWQCFVPCAAGFIDGFGGPMQTIGYMSGFLHVA